MTVTVGFIGLGRMGLPMASNLLQAGFPVVAYDVDGAKLRRAEERGAAAALSPGDAAGRSDVSLSIVMNDAVLSQVASAPDGVLEGAARGHLFVDLSTVSPAASDAVAEAAAGRGVRYLCAKVAGSVGLAERGELTLFASGDRADFAACAEVFRPLATTARFVGGGSAAAALKLVHGLIVGVYSTMIGEALAFGQKGGLDLATLVDVLEAGPLGSRQLTLKAPVLKARAFADPPSDIDTAAKDVDLVLDAGRAAGAALPLTAAARRMMATAQAQGCGKRDIYAILERYEAADLDGRSREP